MLKNLPTYALDKGVIDAHPLIRFHLLPEEQRALRVLTLQEERQLVQAVAEADPVIGAYVALLGETGLRKSEGIKLQWAQIDRPGRLVAVEKTKNKRARYVPLSDFALKWIDPLVRLIHCPSVFVNLKTGRPWLDPRGPFEQGKKAAGLPWVGFHDLRHFRATQWVKLGVDLRSVQEMLGHSTITTTMRYAHFAPTHASRSILEAHKAEGWQLEEREKSGRNLDASDSGQSAAQAQTPDSKRARGGTRTHTRETLTGF